MSISMHDEGLKACCRARFFALFGNCKEWESTGIGNKWKGVKGKNALIRELQHKIKTWSMQTFLIAILNEEQFKRIGEIFIDLGFKVVACGSAIEEGKRLFLLVYINHEHSVKRSNGKKRVVKDSKRSAGMAFF